MNDTTGGTRSRRALWVGLALAVVVIVGAAAALVLRSAPPERQGAAGTEPSVIEVVAARAEVRSLQPSLTVVGTVVADPARQAVLYAATSGLVETIEVEEGAFVHAGDLVVALDERPASVALDSIEASYRRLVAKPRPEEVDQAEALVAKWRAARDVAAARLERSRSLHERSPELVPDAQLLDEEQAVETARAELETAQAQLTLLKKGPRQEVRKETRTQVAAAQLQLDYCRVTAPIDGQLVEVLTRPGERADVGTPLARIVDASEVIVHARIPGDRLAGVLDALAAGGTGTSAVVRSAAFPGEEFEASGGWASAQTEAQTGDVPVRFRVPNPGSRLRVGMTVEVEIHEQAVEGVAIPQTAITVDEDGRRVVTAIRDGKAVPTVVELSSPGRREVHADGWVRVVSGIEAGDLVAVENGYALPEGTPVRVVPAGSGDGSADLSRDGSPP